VGKGEDKPEVAARVTWTKTGIDLATDTPTPEQISDAINQILMKPEFLVCAQKLAREFASHDSAKKLTEFGGGAGRLTQIFANWA
jgi:UDP:flavonoid glycosyltransferase YjiC (YdhE family)